MIKYVKGDATKPITHGEDAIIVHCCNDLGAWGSGFVLALDKAFGDVPRRSYLRHVQECQRAMDPLLGSIDLAQVTPSIWVCNLIGQRGVSSRSTGWNGIPNDVPVRYEAIERGYVQLWLKATDRRRFPERERPSIHMPRMGCGLAGGTWDKVEPLIQNRLGDFDVTVYDL